MKLNLEEQEETIEPVEKTDLIYGIDDRPPFKEALFAALQHLLAIFVAIITPPLIIAGALKLDLETTGFLVSMALFASGVSTFIQCRRIGPVGAKLLCIQGTSFSFIGPIITAGLAGGLPLIFGACIAAAPIEMVISRTFKYMRSIITPLVSGIVVLLIGLSLIKVGVVSCGGGYGAMDNGTFGSIRNIGVAATVLLSVLFFNRCKNKYLRMSSIVLGLCIGYALAYFLGMVDMAAASSQSLMGFNIPMPFKYGLDLNFSAFVAIGLVYLITAIEATGDVTANSMISGKSIEGEDYLKRVSGGVLADGVNSFIAGIFNSFPNSIFAQNNGIIQLTGVASRYVGYYIAGMLVLLGLFPVVGVVFSLMPDPVLGGATLLMFGTVAAAGIRIIASQEINRKATLVLAVSLSLGLGVELMPDILNTAPEAVKGIFSSGITTGGLAAIIANVLIRVKEDKNRIKMELLKQRILQDGRCFPGGILKVDSFINHQMDPMLLYKVAEEFIYRFRDADINKIVTIEASGIAPAIMVGYIMHLPVVFIKKKQPKTMENMLSTVVHSFTKDRDYTVCISNNFLTADDRILFIDDFLAYGNAAMGVLDLVKQSGAKLEGMGFIIEKAFQKGRDVLNEADVRVESLAIIDSLENCTITIR